MKQCNKDALVAMTARLKESVIMSHGLSDTLDFAAGGFMAREEALAVLGKQTNAEQMGELIHILLGKRDADFGIFCNMLRISSNGVWADQLEGKAREFRQKGTPLILL